MPNYAIILYTLREPAREDLKHTLRRVREIGYEYVQWSGMPPMTAEDIRAALDEAGLKAIAGHCSMEPFEEDMEAQIRFWKTVGAPDVAPGGMMNDCKEDLAAWLRGAARLDAIGAKLREAGIRLSYHNHDHEFQYFDGDSRRKIDILYESTSPDNLKAELDLGWVFAAGVDPAAYVRKYAGRCPVIHVKDMLKQRDEKGHVVCKPLGQGEVDWPSVLPEIKAAGVEWCVYEQDNAQGDIFEEAAQSREFLARHLG